MAKLGQFLFLFLVQLFVMKAIGTAVLPVFAADQQTLILEENQENQASDDTFEFNFLDEVLDFNDPVAISRQAYLNSSKKAYSFYNTALYIGFKNESFRPPCA